MAACGRFPFAQDFVDAAAGNFVNASVASLGTLWVQIYNCLIMFCQFWSSRDQIGC